MKSQGLQGNQQVVFMSDGGEDVRRVQTYLHPHSEHWIDWFHITMRITVLQQQTKSLQGEADHTGHPFFIGALFVPQTRSTPETPHPLVTAFLGAVVESAA